MVSTGALLATLAVSFASVQALVPWNETKFVFAFGDSYTTDGFNISAGVNSPVPGDV